MKYTLTCDGQEYAVASSAELAGYLETVRQQDYGELWLNQVGRTALCVLVNRDLAWLMFLQEEGNTGFHSVNPDYVGALDAEIEFFLSNGQQDEYPVRWCVSTSEALQAIRYFFEQGQKPTFISWHED